MRAHLVLATQLFASHPCLECPKSEPIIMIESEPACRALPYHQLKLTFLLSAMRHYAKMLEQQGRKVIYLELQELSVNDALEKIIKEQGVKELTYMAPADKKPRHNLAKLTDKLNIKTEIYPNQLHITSEEDFAGWYKRPKAPNDGDVLPLAKETT
jgi:deoxyribodipyrimidine photolyase-related protein